MKRLAIVLAAMCLTISGPAQAAADYIGFEGAVIDIFEPMSWAEKIAFVKSPWRKQCRKGFGCVYTARLKQGALIFSITEGRESKYVEPFRQWCVEDRDEQRMRCVDQK